MQSAFNEWTGGSGFNGYRLMLELLMCVAPCCAMAASYMGPVAIRLAPYVVAYQLAVTSVAVMIDDSLVESEFWTDNTVLVGLRDQTFVTVTLVASFGLLGWFGTQWFVRRSESRAVAAPIDAQTQKSRVKGLSGFVTFLVHGFGGARRGGGL